MVVSPDSQMLRVRCTCRFSNNPPPSRPYPEVSADRVHPVGGFRMEEVVAHDETRYVGRVVDALFRVEVEIMKRCEGRKGKSKLLGKCAFQVSSEGLSGLTPLDDTADEACAQELCPHFPGQQVRATPRVWRQTIRFLFTSVSAQAAERQRCPLRRLAASRPRASNPCGPSEAGHSELRERTLQDVLPRGFFESAVLLHPHSSHCPRPVLKPETRSSKRRWNGLPETSAVIVTLTSFLYIVDYRQRERVPKSLPAQPAQRLFNQLFRSFVGGFATPPALSQGGVGGNIATCLAEYSGLLFGVLGVMGTWSGRRDWVKSYNAWLWFRLLCYGVMYFFDFPLIAHCEDFVNSLQPTTEKYGYNPLMYNIAMNSQCSSTRTRFLVCSILNVALIMCSQCWYCNPWPHPSVHDTAPKRSDRSDHLEPFPTSFVA
ncbi:unnamed protein product [Symbiodinium sp. KB8]|nr:unnamed protein product [Symbiodinium sp. KB8]